MSMISRFSFATPNFSLISRRNKSRQVLECPICYDEIKRKDSVALKCTHVFHKSCMNKALISGRTECPLGRCEIDDRDISGKTQRLIFVIFHSNGKYRIIKFKSSVLSKIKDILRVSLNLYSDIKKIKNLKIIKSTIRNSSEELDSEKILRDYEFAQNPRGFPNRPITLEIWLDLGSVDGSETISELRS